MRNVDDVLKGRCGRIRVVSGGRQDAAECDSVSRCSHSPFPVTPNIGAV
jgi:hypothetical protein